MKLPQGVHFTIPNVVRTLRKSLYGLKQASRYWYAKLSKVLFQRGYKYSENDYSLCFIETKESVVFLIVYVDDILLTGNDKKEISSPTSFLANTCLLYTSPSPRDGLLSRMPSSA